jgi:hypothetical protein
VKRWRRWVGVSILSMTAAGPSDAFSASIAGRVAADFVVGAYALAGASGDYGNLA